MSKKVEAMGGNMGDAFDDGVFDGVKKITVAIEGGVFNCISYIKIEYEKDRKLETREHGTIRGGLKEFSVDYPNEYIVSIGGSYDHVKYYETVLIKSLFFKTNTGKASLVLGGTTSCGKPAGTEFLLEGKNGGKLLGFFGRSGQALDAIGAYFDTGSLGGVAPLGGKNGDAFDDGVFEGVKKITVGKEGSPYDCISYIKIDYEKDGKVESREHGTIRGELQEFSVDYPNEYITAVGGSYDHVRFYETVLITTLFFKTNTGKTSPILGGGKPGGTEFLLEGKYGEKLLGFFGRSGQALDAIGAYFGSLGGVGPRGGIHGDAFNDGIFIGVKKITVAIEGSPYNCISYIKIEYEKDRKVETREHGTVRGELKEFSVDYPNEYITSVGGRYGHVRYYETVLIKSLVFKTNTGRTSPVFGVTNGTEFLLEGKRGEKLLGFFGRSGQALDAIGAYFGPLGGIKGNTFDDGIFDGVKKIAVGADEFSITYIKIEYEKYGKVEIREHGTNRGELKEFLVDYPKENITAIGGSYNHIFNYDTTLITSLYFTTSRGFNSPLFGKKKGIDFELKGENGEKLLGIYGRGGTAIDAIGAYF